jgi:predicted nicotinamide N-methyase
MAQASAPALWRVLPVLTYPSMTAVPRHATLAVPYANAWSGAAPLQVTQGDAAPMPDASPTALRPVPVPSPALLARLAPLTPVPGRPDLVAHHAPDPVALWQAWEAEYGAIQGVPFWAVVWPAAQLLARVLQAEPAWVRGKTVLDLGCGGGVAGIAAARAGAARVIAHDIDPVALAIAAKNATANAVDLTSECTSVLHGPCSEDTQCILVGDLFYERAAAATLWTWLRMARGRGVQVLIADASRPFAPTTGVRHLREERLATAWAWEGTHERTVRLLTLDA